MGRRDAARAEEGERSRRALRDRHEPVAGDDLHSGDEHAEGGAEQEEAAGTDAAPVVEQQVERVEHGGDDGVEGGLGAAGEADAADGRRQQRAVGGAQDVATIRDALQRDEHPGERGAGLDDVEMDGL